MKRTFQANFTMTISSSGVGFVHVLPTLCSNYFCAHYSSATTSVVDESSVDVSATAVGTSKAYPNSLFLSTPFTSADSTSMNCRLVSAGLRVQYISRVNEMAGIIYCYSHPSNGNVNDQSINNIAAKPQTNTTRVTNKPYVAVMQGINEEDFRFHTAQDSNRNRVYPICVDDYSSSDGGIGNAVLKFAVVGAEPGAQFYCELIQHYEIVGPGLGGAGDLGSVDPIGFAAVSSAGTRVKNEMSGRSYDTRTYQNYFYSAVRSALAEMVPSSTVVGRAAGRAVLGLGARAGALAITGG